MTSITANKIKKSALTLFVEYGYDGTSLTDIGREVGIKKQSIYAHFKNKDDLFLQVMNQVIQEGILELSEYFYQQKNESLDNVLYNFILHLKERYTSDGEWNVKFLLRMMFTPPNHLQEIVISRVFTYYKKLHKYVEEVFVSHEQRLIMEAEKGTISFLNFIDGLLVELIYSNLESFEKRFNVSWEIYWRGITK
ncbi:TetR/AcrR family transcriptional regulator [Halobacillus shinanisalinarum]|uniref:TetR/AcrR family transcriptional regulator n=1 Tax=Halobacillus shinanisalinarum TaxID=2932258 RepID=A0ABY4GW93_9BACI|nr:TetR/AcrR family transcriptional regulator [Halobacillus shinanisalinarum]UOQ92329.1 TetR/AcrR family transcriptional regulator [Halobacillus shinanisalinarum]